ncbi:uncharacterized protein LOC144490289, partial [Mustelus asterias]
AELRHLEVKSQRPQDGSDRSADIPGMEGQGENGSMPFQSCPGRDPSQSGIIQGSAGDLTACDLLDHWIPCPSNQTGPGTEGELQSFSLMQEIIDELRVKRRSTPGDKVNNAGDKNLGPSMIHTDQAATRGVSAARTDHSLQGQVKKAVSPAGSEGKGQLVMWELALPELCSNLRLSSGAPPHSPHCVTQSPPHSSPCVTQKPPHNSPCVTQSPPTQLPLLLSPSPGCVEEVFTLAAFPDWSCAVTCGQGGRED